MESYDHVSCHVSRCGRCYCLISMLFQRRPYFTVTENDDPRILNTDLSDKTLDRKTKLNIEIKVTPIQYTTVTWLLNDVLIAEGTVIDQTLPVGDHVLKIVATTTKGKTTSYHSCQSNTGRR